MILITQSTVNQTFSYSLLKAIDRQAYSTCIYLVDPHNPRHVRRIRKGNVRRGWTVRVICHQPQVFKWIHQSLLSRPLDSAAVLIHTALSNTDKTMPVHRLCIELLEPIVSIDMAWSRRIWTLATRAHLISVTGVYYSVLGGAFCSLGKDDRRYAYKASLLAIEQIKLAQSLRDPLLECKCWLYFAEDLIQLGQLDRAELIMTRQKGFILSMNDFSLSSMLYAVQEKLRLERE